MASDYEARMTFTEHLGELRTRIVRSAIALVVGFVLCFIFSQSILNVIAGPLRTSKAVEVTDGDGGESATGDDVAPTGHNADFVTLGPMEPFFVQMKVAAYAAIVLAFPYILFQLCAFIFPGLSPKERNIARFLIIGCGVLASLGVVVAYFGVFPLVMPYLLLYNPEWVTTQLHLDETVSLIIKGLLGFSVAFQFPMAVIILVYLGVLHPDTLKQHRKIVVVGIAFISAFFTPPDPFSMMLLFIPLYLLYELSILCATAMIWRKNRPEPAGEE